jgi:hypothetical protein
MSTTEDRLIAALAARADQVHPEDLRAPEVPEVAATVTFLRRPAAYAVGIAAAAAAIAAPFVIGGLGTDDAPNPPATNIPSPTLEPQPDIGADWPVAYRQPADLDGDHVTEQVRLRAEPGDPLTGPRIRVESDLSSGESVFGIADSGGVSVNFMEPADLDVEGGQELMLNRDQADGIGSDWLVVDLVDGQLIELEQDGSAPLSWGDVPDPADPDLAFATDRWVTKAGALYSARTVRSFPRYGMSFELPDPYVAEVWAWQVDGLRLVPVAQPQLCISTLEESRKPCTGDQGEDLPDFYPEETELIGVGESFEEDVDFDGRADTIALEGTVTDGSVGEGDVELVVTTTGSGEKRWPVPAGWAPQVYATTIQIGMVDGLSLLVSQEGGDSTTLTYVATGQEGFAGDLIAVETDGAPFGGGFSGEDATPYRTWVGADDRMYTKVGPPMTSSNSAAPAQIYLWSLVPGPRLTAVDLGTFCEDTVSGDITRC